ncbi:DNA-binding transcriptional activator of the SARP family [Amycolatopsis xylanica]|uniref:DNA-binding transcriptional activator of the SARP family n=1 Tax=Amycolatopsis xylanica TaxID=589385 RepID=A0A1H2S7C1_9PSEU|nr:tetratricopeptide repeat protein [Amycolatopsis xylanica]SDW27523.1 DNA-binding transcriptional activator of the SARP family [Amycolatopsis xylanica]
MDIAFGILGRTGMRLHGQLSVQWGRPKEREILAALLVQPNRRVSVDLLADWVWGDQGQEPHNPASTFRTHTGRIRSAWRDAGLPGELRTEDGSYVLAVDRGAIDYFAFADLVGQARTHSARGEHAEALAVITSAIGLWTEQPLADLRSERAENWRRRAILDQWLPANQVLVGELVALGRFEAALDRLDELHEEHATDTGLVKRRLEILYALDRPIDAQNHFLTVYKQLKATGDRDAADELRRAHDSLVPTAKVTVTRKPCRSLLPNDPGDFVGRAELKSALDRLARTADGRLQPGLIILDGLAGIGKTSLAVHWAHRQLGSLADNVVYLDMHGFEGGKRREAADVVDELLQFFDVPADRLTDAGRRAAKVREILDGTRTLLVLDNVADSDHLRPLLLTLSRCLLLVTSRHRLTALATRHGGRHCSVPLLDSALSVEFLTRRVGGRAVDGQEAIDRLAALCAGLPLALQLVVHHIDARPDAALTQFADEFADQGRLLDIGDDGDDPHANLRAALSFTYNALREQARRLFRALGLSPTPEISLHAATALLGEPLRETQRLIDILVSTHLLTPTGTPDRYRMHDLVRAFARELATDGAAAELRLLSFYLHTSYQADRMLFPFRTPVPMLEREPGAPVFGFKTEQEAAEWLLDERLFTALIPWAAQRGHDAYAWRLPHNLYGIFRRHGHYQQLAAMFEIAVSSTQACGDLESEGATRSDLSLLYGVLGDWTRSLQEHHLAAAIARRTGSAVGIPISLFQLAGHKVHLGELHAAVETYHKALAQVVSSGEKGLQASILHDLAKARRLLGEHGTAVELFQRALRLRRAANNRHGQAATLTELAATLHEENHLATARIHADEALTIAERINDIEIAPRVCGVLAAIHYDLENLDNAVGYARQAVRLAAMSRDSQAEAHALRTLGQALFDLGRYDAAEEGWRLAESIYTDLGDRAHLRLVQANLTTLATVDRLPKPRPETNYSRVR